MKNKEDASKVKSDEYLAFEALAKRIITNNKEKTVNEKPVLEGEKPKESKQKGSKQ